ncbi:hypothetical protein BKA70DRAFT_1232796 [Coprinopsis sp. MPI-PUGE-AT-0042]|nr:hypothetical protein BKA70DRAFT_1232796 [Coprinopsis sp. MPI-PUGE-AT-0042]
MGIFDQAPGLPYGEACQSVAAFNGPGSTGLVVSRMPADGGGYTCIDLNKCVANIDGVLTLGGRGFAASSTDWHFPHSYPYTNDAVMVATCQKVNGEWVKSELNLEDHLRMNKGVLEVVTRAWDSAIYGNLNKIFGGAPPSGFAPGIKMVKDANSSYDENGRHYRKELSGMYDFYEDKLGFHIWVGGLCDRHIG